MKKSGKPTRQERTSKAPTRGRKEERMGKAVPDSDSRASFAVGVVGVLFWRTVLGYLLLTRGRVRRKKDGEGSKILDGALTNSERERVYAAWLCGSVSCAWVVEVRSTEVLRYSSVAPSRRQRLVVAREKMGELVTTEKGTKGEEGANERHQGTPRKWQERMDKSRWAKWRKAGTTVANDS